MKKRNHRKQYPWERLAPVQQSNRFAAVRERLEGLARDLYQLEVASLPAKEIVEAVAASLSREAGLCVLTDEDTSGSA